MLAREQLAPSAASAVFAREVAEYLQRRPRQLPSRFFYDALGSALFDAICRLPWYRVTRAESALLADHARRICHGLTPPLNIAELGCGNGEKLAVLLEHAGYPVDQVHLIDISRAALDNAASRLTPLADSITAFQGTYEAGLHDLKAHRRRSGSWLLLFLGSNIGNFDPPVARQMLRAMRMALDEGDALLLGTDLVKPERELQLAYDDPLGVTAAFNRNLLRRINDELGGTFDLDTVSHRALWNAEAGRVEMHVVSMARQRVRIEAADLDITLEPNEWIWTESSYKWEPGAVIVGGRAAGFRGSEQWVDHDARFALTRFTV
jgi:L-histidine N-alpha-methyltransferase